MNYDLVNEHYRCFIAEISKIHEPLTFEEVRTDTHWMEAMKAEIQALQDNNTWEIVDLPQSKSAIGCKWVYRVKYHANGTLERYKARLVAKGFTQNPGTNFT